MKTLTIPGQPIAKPRMTQQDKWLKRKAVVAYWEWAAKARSQAVEALVFDEVAPAMVVVIRAYFGFPPSYSGKKCVRLGGKPHIIRPDSDNIGKAVLDSIWPKDDSAVYDLRIVKRWDDGAGPRVEIQAEEGRG